MVTVKAANGHVAISLAAGVRKLNADRQRVLRAVGQALIVNIRRGMEAERSPEGYPWTPLKPSTVRQRKGDAHPILQQSGRLKKSITMRQTSESVIVGTNLIYAPVHQFGAEIRKKAGATKLHFRRITRGSKKGQVRFTRASDRRAVFGMAAGAHTVQIPARPFLFQKDGDIPAAWKAAVVRIVSRYLEK